MAKKGVGKNGANKKLHTKLRKRKIAKEQEAKENRKRRLKELGKSSNKINQTQQNDPEM